MKFMQDIRVIQANRTEPRTNTAMTLLSAVRKVMFSQLYSWQGDRDLVVGMARGFMLKVPLNSNQPAWQQCFSV